MGGLEPMLFTIYARRAKGARDISYELGKPPEAELLATISYGVRWRPRDKHDSCELKRIIAHHSVTIDDNPPDSSHVISLQHVRTLIDRHIKSTRKVG